MATFNDALDGFITKCQEISDIYMETNFANLPKAVIELSGGAKYAKVIRKSRPDDQYGSVHCFVANEDGFTKKLGSFKAGDVFKADGTKGPARGVRGNIFDEHNGIARMGPYGTDYNR